MPVRNQSFPRGRGAARTAVAVAALVWFAAGPAAAAPLTLEEAVARAVSISEDVRAADAERAQADAEVDRAFSALLPTVTATATYTRRAREITRDVGGTTATIQSANALSGNLTVATSLFDGRAYPLLRAARARRDAVGLDARERRRQVGFAAAAAYLDALAQEQVVTAAQRRRDFAAARRDDAAARVGARLVSSNDLTQAELELAAAERDLIATGAALDGARAELTYWLGGPPGGSLVEPAALIEAEPNLPTVDALIDAAGRSRPDLAAGRRRIDAAAETADEPGRRLWPTLDLVGQVRFTNETGLSGRSADWLVGLTATWVLWDGRARAADQRIAELDTERARLGQAAAERRVAADLTAALARLRAARAALEPATRVAAAAARHADEIAVLYGQGLARALEVADAGARRFDADVGLVRARLDVAAATLELSAARGDLPPGASP